MNELDEIQRTINQVNKAVNGLMPKAAVLAVNFFKDRFRQQNWMDHYIEYWKRRKERGRRRSTRAILTKTGRLRRSIRKGKITATTAVIESDTPYGFAHNYGFTGTVNVKTHKRRKGRERKRSKKAEETEPTIVKAHTRRMRMPRRQFMGESAVLSRQIERMATAEIMKALK